MSYPLKRSDVDIVPTSDGSLTLRHREFDETYHSTHGALQESRHIFLQASGAAHRAAAGLATSILEIGFGTGLNFLLTAQAFLDHQTKLNYVAFEKFPVSVELLTALNYGATVQAADWPVRLVNQQWIPGDVRICDDNISLCVHIGAAEALAPANTSFDIVYLDAFSPEKCPELWTSDFLHKLAQALVPDGVLVTYCAQGNFRRALSSDGLHVERLPGPPGKRHMTRATKR